MLALTSVIPNNIICHPELVSGSSRLGRSRNEFGMTGLKGFTLIELLVVISIIAILSSVGFVSYQGVRNKAIEAKVKTDIDSIKKAYETNYDPSLNGGQGGYKPLFDTNFASGKIPTDKNGDSYIVVGSYATTADPNPTTTTTNFGVCGDTTTGEACTLPGGSCKCIQSTQGTGSFDFLTQPSNLISNPSFETNLSGWTSENFVMVQSPDALFGTKSLRITSAAMPYGAVVRTNPEITTIANKNYTISAWIKASNTTGNQGIAFIVYGPGFDNSPGQIGIPANGTWTKISLGVNTSYTSLGVMFRNTDPYNRPVDILVDGVQFIKED